MRVEKWAAERDETFKRSLGQLKADILKANALVQEANHLAEEMARNTKFSVTLQIPPANLSPNRKVGIFSWLRYKSVVSNLSLVVSTNNIWMMHNHFCHYCQPSDNLFWTGILYIFYFIAVHGTMPKNISNWMLNYIDYYKFITTTITT